MALDADGRKRSLEDFEALTERQRIEEVVGSVVEIGDAPPELQAWAEREAMRAIRGRQSKAAS